MEKLDALMETSGRQSAPEFFDPPQCPYYKVRAHQQALQAEETNACMGVCAGHPRRRAGLR